MTSCAHRRITACRLLPTSSTARLTIGMTARFVHLFRFLLCFLFRRAPYDAPGLPARYSKRVDDFTISHTPGSAVLLNIEPFHRGMPHSPSMRGSQGFGRFSALMRLRMSISMLYNSALLAISFIGKLTRRIWNAV